MVNQTWEEFLKIVNQEAGSRFVETWLKAVRLDRWDSLEQVVYLQAPNKFVKEWLQSKYLHLFQVHLGRLLHVDALKVVFLDQAEEKSATVKHTGDEIVVTPSVARTSSVGAKISRMPAVKTSGHVNKSYLFDTFVVGPSNSLAYAAAQAVAAKPGHLYNPLLIYGDSGLGKTHLLHAIGNEIKSYDQRALVLYQTADRFVNEFINAIRFDKVHKFQAKYKEVDVLLIDDIQFISNKEQTQEAFFHIFNSLYDLRKQIVFTSDTFPKDISGVAERLRSRLEWGLVTDIRMPRIETKIAILKRKADLSNEVVSDEVANFIASCVDSNIRELEGALIRVMAFASLTRQAVSLELAKKVLTRSRPHKSRTVTFEQIVRVVTQQYDYNLTDLRSKSKNKNLSFVRQVAMFLMRKMTGKSLREVGHFLKRKDHSTVLHAVEKIQKMVAKDPSVSAQMKRLEGRVLS